ncbi:MAG: hypothetical protein HDS11_04750 [Bacteroides sp.]|nr:hypothetical protein [Bacteroides sp.]
MKYLLPILLVLTLVSVSCSNKQTKQTQVSTETSLAEDRDKENKAFRRQTFEKFINTEDSIIDNGESSYLLMLDCIVDDKDKTDSEDYKGWYRKNVAQSRYCIVLSDNGNEEELLKILAAELGNFQSHPIATTYVCFDLNIILTNLYFSQADQYPDYLQKCIDLWELNRVQINAVQAGWQEYHPQYMEVLKILLHLYESVNNSQKVAEIQGLINEATAQIE